MRCSGYLYKGSHLNARQVPWWISPPCPRASCDDFRSCRWQQGRRSLFGFEMKNQQAQELTAAVREPEFSSKRLMPSGSKRGWHLWRPLGQSASHLAQLFGFTGSWDCKQSLHSCRKCAIPCGRPSERQLKGPQLVDPPSFGTLVFHPRGLAPSRG